MLFHDADIPLKLMRQETLADISLHYKTEISCFLKKKKKRKKEGAARTYHPSIFVACIDSICSRGYSSNRSLEISSYLVPVFDMIESLYLLENPTATAYHFSPYVHTAMSVACEDEEIF